MRRRGKEAERENNRDGEGGRGKDRGEREDMEREMVR